jgi:hypothetical protein
MRSRADLKDYNGLQAQAMRRWCRETALDPLQWDAMGYAKAFEAAYDALPEKVRNDGSTLYALTLATAGKVGRILG